MNWDSLRFDWNQVRAFLATVEEGSLSAAARALHLTQPTLGRQVAALEQDLGVTLFERVGRGMQLTEAGLELLEHVRDMGAAANRISLTASGQSQTVEGLVRLSVTETTAAWLMPPILADLRQHAPRIDVELVVSNTLSDLRQREADIALRHVRPTQPDLIARLVRTQSACFYAAQRYLDRFGPIDTAQQLARADFIGFDDQPRMIAWLNDFGLPITNANIRVRSDSFIAAWELARAGLGVTMLGRDLADRFPDMVRVAPDMPEIEVPFWLTSHRELQTSRRIRTVYDFLAEALSKPQ
ncbi:transcriptional regulator, LysR family protein [Actibacterium atlanticum]|uniref:Transcriptional regulator, LysR family protein n=1 Tax=Actibacterium atlanticum TaxID=1461693 RepID=A0A058ZHB9_9RHOB|nr:LysR family transcriptional regulator [Actibacterium atlanticum]KCV81029.1 transcriptional regulator, LysR family protein [Actibacterium atlanticum]